MSNLQLSLKRKWFDMTDAGIKTEDYREITPYWVKRLTKWHKNDVCSLSEAAENLMKGKDFFPNDWGNNLRPDYCFPKDFSTNTTTLGYPKRSDFSRIRIYDHAGIEIRTGNPEWGAEPGKLYFVIKHGKRIQ